MNLINGIQDLKQKVIENNLEGIIERINIEDVDKAYVNVRCMALESVEDYLLFFSSLNLLNSYVKKEYAISKKYDFKKEASKGIESLITWNPNEIIFSYNKDISVIDIAGLQFSFHNIEITKLMEQKSPLNTEIKWDGIKLQPSAVSIFYFANSLDGLSKKSMFGLSLEDLYTQKN